MGAQTWQGHMNALVSIRSKQLQPVVTAFLENVMRIGTSAVTPAQIAWQVRRDQVICDCARFRATGKLEPDLLQLEKEVELPDEYGKEREKLIKEFFTSLTLGQEEQFLDRYGVGYINVLLEKIEGMQLGIEALLASITIEAWTAFESLAADLWALGVDDGPEEIAARLLLASKSFRSPEDSIGPEKAHEIGVNPKTNFGTFLKRTGKVPLQRLRDIQSWYGRAFGKAAKDSFDQISDGYIFALAAVRNALTHAAGRADSDFVKAAQRFPELRNYQLTEKILLDGDLVRKLREAAHALAVHLIQLVDDLLTPQTG